MQSGLSARLAQLSPKKQELLLRHLAAQRAPTVDDGGIRPHSRDRTAFPQSFAQRSLWLFDRLQPGSAAYNVYEALRLNGYLDTEALAAACAEVVSRHEVLRVSFALDGETPVQLVGPVPANLLPQVDLAGLTAGRCEAELLRLATAEAGRPFDLVGGPVCRFRLIRLSAGAVAEPEHALLVTLHHIVSDAGSMEILFGELRSLYASFAARRPSALPAMTIQYTDFAEWQQSWMSGERLDRQLAWWRERLAGAHFSLPLPVDRPRSPRQTAAGARLHLEVPSATGAALAALARRAGASTYMLFLAAFAALLSRVAGSEDLLIGGPLANRDRPELERLIGFFVNTVVLRVELSDGPGFRDLLARIREVCLGAFANADLPFERLVEAVQPDRDLRRVPLFQVLFSLAAGAPPADSGLAPGIAVSRLSLATRFSKFDLALVLVEADRRVFGSLEYNTELFDATTVTRLAGHFNRLLAAVAGDPEAPVSALPLLSEAERHHILLEWNDVSGGHGRGDTLPARFAAQAARQPEAVALIAGGREVGYAKLDSLACRLASLLRSLGAGPEVRVAVCLERSVAMVAAVLAVWKAGGAFVALDPDLPPERAAAVLVDSGAAVLLTRELLRGRFPSFTQAVLCLDGDRVPESGPPASFDGSLDPDTLAYVVYTSGSTGRPKGVLTTHGGVAGYVFPLLDLYGLGPGDRVLQLPSLVFDAAVRDLLAPLAAGATVVLAGQEEARDALALLSLIDRRQVTRLLSVVPTVLRALLAGAPRDGVALGALKTLLVSGERLFPEDCRQAWEVFGDGMEIANQYGPTECTMTSSRHRLPRSSAASVAERAGVPVGRPIPGRRFYLLDRRLCPVPGGSAGDLYIGGPGMARGYLDRPDLTAAAFLPDPFGAPGERLYATGDRARHRADGTLEFLGRADQQVKIRGLRVEPGEVEAALAAQRGVRQAAVVACGEGAELRLVAYLLTDVRIAPTAELRRSLLNRLPEAMVPSVFVKLDALPLTPTGKVDRKALSQRSLERAPPVPPRNRLELALLGLWEELLPGQIFGVRDNFFELGGHSLLAVQLLVLIQRRFGQSLRLAVLFAGATIESLAGMLGRQSAPATSLRVEIQRGAEGERPLFLVHPAGGTALCYVGLARFLGRVQPVFGLEDPNFAGTEEPRFVLPEMVALYLRAVREVQPKGPYWLGGWSLGGVLAQELACQLEDAGEEVEHLLLLDSRSPVRRAGEARIGHSETDLLFWFAENLHVGVTREEVEELPAAERFPSILARAQAVGRLAADLEPAQARRIFDIYLTELASAEEHQPRPCRCRITLFRAAAGVAEESARGEDHTVGWSGVSTVGLDIEIVPGAHQTLMDEPYVQTLAQEIRERLDGRRP